MLMEVDESNDGMISNATSPSPSERKSSAKQQQPLLMDIDELNERVYEIPQIDVSVRRRELVKRIENLVREIVGCVVKREPPQLSFNDGKYSGWSNTVNVATMSNAMTDAQPDYDDEDDDDDDDDDDDCMHGNSSGEDDREEGQGLDDLETSGSGGTSANCEGSSSSNSNQLEGSSGSSGSSSRASGQAQLSSTSGGYPSEESEKRLKTLAFTGNRPRQRFALVMRLLSYVHENLISYLDRVDDDEFYCTKRAFFYSLKNEPISRFAKKQHKVDWALNQATLLIDCAPWEIGFVSTSKGLIAGDLTLHLGPTRRIEYKSDYCQAVPDVVANVTRIRTTASYVLVVEKDSVFQKLLRERCSAFNNCILITGKGYPDIPTRFIVAMLWEKIRLPTYALVDANPHGFEIMCTYR